MTDFKPKMHPIRFRLGLRPDPAGEAYSAPPVPLAGFGGRFAAGGWAGLWKRRERGGKGREGEVEWREREGPKLLLNQRPSELGYATGRQRITIPPVGCYCYWNENRNETVLAQYPISARRLHERIHAHNTPEKVGHGKKTRIQHRNGMGFRCLSRPDSHIKCILSLKHAYWNAYAHTDSVYTAPTKDNLVLFLLKLQKLLRFFHQIFLIAFICLTLNSEV